MKKSLVHLHAGGELNYAEFECLLARAANVINDRPLGVSIHRKAKGELIPVTPNLLLMAKTATSSTDLTLSEDEPSRLAKNQKRMEEVLVAWWNQWFSQVFSSLVPYQKWKKEASNLAIGDICLVKYEHKVGKSDYRICKVVEVEEDTKGLVRTVTIAMRPRDSREKSLPYKSKKLKNLRLAVQRLVLICPAKEAEEILKADQDSRRTQTNAIINGWHVFLHGEDGDAIEDDETADDSKGPAVPDESQFLQHYAFPAYRGSAQGMLSFGLTQSFPTESFAQNMQETNPEGC